MAPTNPAVPPPTGCPFLSIPTELRLEIYSYAMLDCRHVTIGIAKLQGHAHDIVHRLYGGKREPYAGIPENSEPVVEASYRRDLLCPVDSAVLPLTPATIDPPEDIYEHAQTAYHTLKQLNKQVHEELKLHFSLPTKRQTSLFLQYPHGLHILHTTTPQLLQQSRSVHLAGAYLPRTYCPPRAAAMGSRYAPTQEKLQGGIIPDEAAQLGSLIKSCLGPKPQHPMEKLEMRIYYPGSDSYSTVWGDDSSPIVVALRNIHLGEIGIEIWRGSHGTAVYLTAKAATERKRVVSTVWRQLREGRRGEAKCGSWVVDPNWPKWNLEYEASPGPRGDTITSRPAVAS